jgi:hypothetical protein
MVSRIFRLPIRLVFIVPTTPPHKILFSAIIVLLSLSPHRISISYRKNLTLTCKKILILIPLEYDVLTNLLIGEI